MGGVKAGAGPCPRMEERSPEALGEDRIRQAEQRLE